MSTMDFPQRGIWNGGADIVFNHAWPLIAGSVVSYLLLVRLLRYRNLRWLESKYRRYVAETHAMDYKTAHEIFQTSMFHEFPFLFVFSLQWAIVKSYTIANGTKLLAQTRQLTDKRLVGRRSEDTALILHALLGCGIDTDSGLKALAKMNWLHARYGSKISNSDMIHTLALFVLEPPRWIAWYDWRPMSELEKVAIFIYWKEIGNRMGIQNIPDTLENLQKWTHEYEKTAMVYSDNNRKCYEASISLYLRSVPAPMKGFAAKIADSFLEDHVQPFLGVEPPPAWARRMVKTFFAARAFVLRHFSLPRFRSAQFPRRQSPDGRWLRQSWAFEPWYVEETMWMRIRKQLGLAPKVAPGPEYQSQGYLTEELGPQAFEKSSKKEVMMQVEQLKEYADNGGAVGVGCPFAFAN